MRITHVIVESLTNFQYEMNIIAKCSSLKEAKNALRKAKLLCEEKVEAAQLLQMNTREIKLILQYTPSFKILTMKAYDKKVLDDKRFK